MPPKVCNSTDYLGNQERCIITGEWTSSFLYHQLVRGDSARETQIKTFVSNKDEASANSLILDIVTDYVKNGFKAIPPVSVADTNWQGTYFINNKSAGIVFQYYDSNFHSLPSWLYLKDSTGISDPWLLNKPNIFFVDNEKINPGQLNRIFGRNLTSINVWVTRGLSYNDGKPRLKCYLVSKQADLSVKSNYKEVQVLDSVSGDGQGHFFEEGFNVGRFIVPVGTPDGDYYLLWYIREGDTSGVCHTTITVAASSPQTFIKRISPTLNYDNLEVDHASIIQSAILEAFSKTKAIGGTKFDKAVVLLAPGDYYIGSVLVIPPYVELKGSGRDCTRIIIKSNGFSNLPKYNYTFGPGNINLYRSLFASEQPDTFIRMTENSGLSDIGVESSKETYGPKFCLYLKRIFEPSVKYVNINNNKFIHPRVIEFNGSESLVLCESIIERMNFEDNHCIAHTMFDHTFGDSIKIRCNYKGNLFQTQRIRNSYSGVMSVLGIQCIFENNTIDGLYRGIFSSKNDGAKYQNMILNNQHINGSQFIEGSESVAHEDYDEAYSGPVTIIDSVNFIIPDVKWYFGINLTSNGFKNNFAVITKGKGFGQIRRIVKSTVSPVQITIDRPWEIEPDSTSSVSISNIFYQNLICNWHASNTKGGIQLTKSIDNAIIYCSFYNSFEGLTISSFIGSNTYSPYNSWQWGGSWFNTIKYCKFINSNIFLFSTREYASVSSKENVVGVFGTSIHGCFIVNTPVSLIDRVCEGFTTVRFDDPKNADKVAIIKSSGLSIDGTSLTMNKFDSIMMPWCFFTQACERTPNYDLISVFPHGVGGIFCNDVQGISNKIFYGGVSIDVPIKVLTRYLGQF